MKLKKIFFGIVVTSIYLFPFLEVHALARSQFPDPKRNRPIPTFVEPNFSGNVNVDLGGEPIMRDENGEIIFRTTESEPILGTPIDETPLPEEENSNAFSIYGIGTILAITATWIFLLKRKMGEKN